MIFQLGPGLLYQYDAATNAWIPIISSDFLLPTATSIKSGAMTAADFQKLNRLVLPPPTATIAGDGCLAPFKAGFITLRSSDEFVNIEGNLDVRNIDEFGDTVSQQFPFHIHQHTYGFDFNLDLPALIEELKDRDQFNIVGQTGDKGATGAPGAPGIDEVLAGPRGDQGLQGLAPPCGLSVDIEPVQAEPRPGPKRALTAVRVVADPDDPLQYSLEFDRQTIGSPETSGDKFNVRQQRSTWVLAVASVAGTPQSIFYFDIEPILEAIHTKYLSEVDRLRTGYKDVVSFWVQTMSELFDEQKDALCCAIEYCMSKTNSIQVRQHMESVAAAAAGKAKIVVNDVTGPQGTKIPPPAKKAPHYCWPWAWKPPIYGHPVPGLQTPCLPEPLVPFPPSPPLSAASGGTPAATVPQIVTSAGAPQVVSAGVDAYDLCPGNHSLSASAANIEAVEVQSMVAPAAVVTQPVTFTVAVDPLIHIHQNNGAKVELEPGHYIAAISKMIVQINGKHYAPIAIQYNSTKPKTVRFLDKGRFKSLLEAKSAYEGLTVSFDHTGGPVSLYFNIFPTNEVSGNIVVVLYKQSLVKKQVESVPTEPIISEPVQPDPVIAVDELEQCMMSPSKLAWYSRSWESGNCCGCIINVSNQPFIIIKRSIGIDTICGGGEDAESPCIAAFMHKYGHPAFAWPTLDGKTFAPIPDGGIIFAYDPQLNAAVSHAIEQELFVSPKGHNAGVRFLGHQLSTVLFPMV